ncbi:MAG TPA: hypothetical protein VEY95_14420 [Azospirillaceae bacterium]|nr:hypothetical protein [Azospirillaceae bacterium]
MAHYHEIYAFQQGRWTLVQVMNASRDEVDDLVGDLSRRGDVLGVRVLREEATGNGKDRMRMIRREDKAPGLPAFVLGADGKPMYGGRGRPEVETRRTRPRSSRTASPMPVRPPARKQVFTPSELVLGTLTAIAGGTSLIALERLGSVAPEWASTLGVARFAMLASLIGLGGGALVRLVRSGALFEEGMPRRSMPAVRTAPAMAVAGGTPTGFGGPERIDANEDVLIRRAIALVETGFRRIRDEMDGFGWFGFRLFMAGIARGMAPAGPPSRQQRYLWRLLERIGDAPAQIQEFLARRNAALRVPRNAQMADAGQRAWENGDPDALARAMDRWARMGETGAPVHGAVVCLVPVHMATGPRTALLRLIPDLASALGGQHVGTDHAHAVVFPNAVGALRFAEEILKANAVGRPQIGIAAAIDAEAAAAEAHTLATRAAIGEVLVSGTARDLAERAARFAPPDATGVAKLIRS